VDTPTSTSAALPSGSRTLWISVAVAVIVGAIAWFFGFHMGREELRTAMSLKIG
jgi:hypothetical protein